MKLAEPMRFEKGQPCKKGETAARSGCIPASGKVGASKQKPTAKATKQTKQPAKQPQKRTPPPPSHEDTPQQVDKRLRAITSEWRRKLSPKEREAISDYVTPGAMEKRGYNFRKFNRALRACPGMEMDCLMKFDPKESKYFSEDMLDWLANINKAIDKAGKLRTPVTVYRGITVKALNIDKVLDQFRNASEVQLPGIVSTSTSKQRAMEYARQGGTAIMFQIKARSGVYVQPLVDRLRGTEDDEWGRNDEFVQKHNTKYKVAGVRTEYEDSDNWNGQPIDWVRELNDLPPEEAQKRADQINDNMAGRKTNGQPDPSLMRAAKSESGKWMLRKPAFIVELEEV